MTKNSKSYVFAIIPLLEYTRNLVSKDRNISRRMRSCIYIPRLKAMLRQYLVSCCQLLSVDLYCECYNVIYITSIYAIVLWYVNSITRIRSKLFHLVSYLIYIFNRSASKRENVFYPVAVFRMGRGPRASS